MNLIKKLEARGRYFVGFVDDMLKKVSEQVNE